MVNVYKYGGITPRKPPKNPSTHSDQMIVKYGGISPKPTPPPGFLIPENEEDIGNPFEKFSIYQIITAIIKELIKLSKRVKGIEENKPSIFPVTDGPEIPTLKGKESDLERRFQKGSGMMQ